MEMVAPSPDGVPVGSYIRSQGDIDDATGYAMDALGTLEQAAAAAVGETALVFRQQDGSISDFFVTLAGEVGDGVADARKPVDQVSQWGAGGQVREVANATSYLVAPSNPENPCPGRARPATRSGPA